MTDRTTPAYTSEDEMRDRLALRAALTQRQRLPGARWRPGHHHIEARGRDAQQRLIANGKLGRYVERL